MAKNRHRRKRRKSLPKCADRVDNVKLSGGSSLYNPLSGMGGGTDKAKFTQMGLMHRPHQQDLDQLYYQSWAARKLIDLPIDDMMRRWREWDVDDLRMSEALVEIEERFEIREYLVKTAKSARLYGSALLIFVDGEEDMALPLDVSTWRPGRLLGLRSVGSYEYTIPEIDQNFLSPTYGEPKHYIVHTDYGSPMVIHPSRVLRFWGMKSLSHRMSWNFDMRYGVSILQPVLAALFEDETIAASVAHLVQETSIPIVQVPGLREALSAAGPVDFDTVDASQYMSALNANKGIYRTLLLDQDEEFKRVDVSWGGIPELMDRMASRLAAAADIPSTRFEGRSPVGMNATGDSDMDNYVLMLEAERHRQWGPGKLRRIDEILTMEVGLSLADRPSYRWPSLRLVNPREETELAVHHVNAVVKALDYNLLDEEEARVLLENRGFFAGLVKQDGRS